MASAYPASRTAVFEQLRRRLFGIAYRMIGTTADAEDIVQEAYLRWHQADAEEIRSAEAWLVARLYLQIAKKLGTRLRTEILTINGEPGLVMYLDGALRGNQAV